jgi:hypothetical protein
MISEVNGACSDDCVTHVSKNNYKTIFKGTIFALHLQIDSSKLQCFAKYWGRKFWLPTHSNPLVQNSGYPNIKGYRAFHLWN